MTDELKKQVEMHRDFFVRCGFAINNGFYLEAILMEYAAIESRLESICGILSLPCGKDCPNRRDIKISHRIECLRVFRRNNETVFAKTKLPINFFAEKGGELKTWIRDRDQRVHGLYKDEEKYKYRISKNKELAENGLLYARLLYNEANRLRRLKKNHNEVFVDNVLCCKCKTCKARIEP